MKKGIQALLASGSGLRRSRWLVIVFVVLVLVGLSFILEEVILSHQEGQWESIAEQKCQRDLDAAERGFTDVQRAVRRIAAEAALTSRVQGYLSGRDTNRVELFTEISAISRAGEVGLEVYDRNGTLQAWEGRSGPMHRHEVRLALDGQMSSYVTTGPVASQLFVAVPVREQGSIIGVLLVRKIIEIDYPLSNRFIRREGLAERLSQEIGADVRYDFTPEAVPEKDGRFASRALYGIDSAEVGVASISRPVRSASLERLGERFRLARSLLLTIVFGIIGVIGVRTSDRVRNALGRVGGITLLIWLIRYAFLAIDVPSGFAMQGIFDPVLFASKFGGGLAKSIGELTLTSVALLLNIGACVQAVARSRPASAVWWTRQKVYIRIAAALVITAALFWLLRGYAAVVRSAVFDSTLTYSDPAVIIPAFELGVMMFNLFVVGFCLVIVAVGVARVVLRLLSSEDGFSLASWGVACALFLLAAAGFATLQENPLMGPAYQLGFAVLIIGATFLLWRRQRAGGTVPMVPSLLTAFLVAGILIYPLLTSFVLEKDRQRIETFARGLVRPVDSWLRHVIDEALARLDTDEAASLLSSRDRRDVEQAAFTIWSGSTACREGYTSLFALTDTAGGELSRFSIGGQIVAGSLQDLVPMLGSGPRVRVREEGSGVNALRIYAGSTPIHDARGVVVGYGVVVVSAGQRTLFRGANPPLLRGATEGEIESFYRPVTVSEFRNGILLTSNNPDLPIGYTLPEVVRGEFTDSTTESLWSTQDIDGRAYETYLVRRIEGRNDIIALSLETPGLMVHVQGIVKLLVCYAIIVLLVVSAVLVVRLAQRRRYAFTFRDRLLVALLVTAIIPLAVLMLYARYDTRERLMENLARRLDEQTATVAASVVEQAMQSNVEGFVSPAQIEQTASDLGTDFNVYVGSELRISSRPELFEIGILDSRLSGSAYAQVFLQGKRFHVDDERIGLYQYAVGYRPVLDNAGAIVGAVSVPALFRQEQLERELVERNAVLVAVYVVVLLALLGIATAFASRIAAPIRRLTEATRRVARGDLGVTVAGSSADDEIGELIRSFDAMTRDLRQNRDELIRYERELAWKEMAQQVAHEIKNPLTPMKLAIQHLRQTYRDNVRGFDQVIDEVTRTVIEQIEALSRIASEFSHFGRMPERKPEECDVNAVLTESVHLFRQDSGVNFEVDLAEGLPVVVADRDELRRAFINVIRNGVQAMNNAGRMVITSHQQEQGAAITIRDFGPGISEDVRLKLFQPKFSTKTEGMGLGLALVKKTLDDLGGTITIESTPGEGTTVRILLPGKKHQPSNEE